MMKTSDNRLVELKAYLDSKVKRYNTRSFIEEDPISVPHHFSLRQDREIMGLFAALFAWGKRKTTIKKAFELAERMDNAPYQFIRNHQPADLKRLEGFVHRTFNDTDLLYLIEFLQHHYRRHDTLERAFFPESEYPHPTVEQALIYFHNYVFSLPEFPQRTRKHIPTPLRKSTCKRLNMFLRWMVRSDEKGVDFGLWKTVTPASLIMPVDVHVARVVNALGIIETRVVNWDFAIALTRFLRQFDPEDPVKYDYALFGIGLLESPVRIFK